MVYKVTEVVVRSPITPNKNKIGSWSFYTFNESESRHFCFVSNNSVEICNMLEFSGMIHRGIVN